MHRSEAGTAQLRTAGISVSRENGAGIGREISPCCSGASPLSHAAAIQRTLANEEKWPNPVRDSAKSRRSAATPRVRGLCSNRDCRLRLPPRSAYIQVDIKTRSSISGSPSRVLIATLQPGGRTLVRRAPGRTREQRVEQQPE
jgi:hypothetical protein